MSTGPLRCANPASWHPTLHRIEKHHSPPKSWTLDDGAGSDLVDLCGICHSEVHSLLNLYVHAGGRPSWSDLRTFSSFVRTLADQAWAKRIEGRTPYTLAAG